jgi:hypothetical protein
MRATLILVGVLAVSGCGTVQSQIRDVNAASDRIRAECATRQTRLTQEQCANTRIFGLYNQVRIIPESVIEDYLEAREAIASQFDNGKIDEAERRVRMANAKADANRASAPYLQAKLNRQAAQFEAAADSLAIAGATIQANTPQPYVPHVSPVMTVPYMPPPPPAQMLENLYQPRPVTTTRYVPISPGDPLNAGLNSSGYPTR